MKRLIATFALIGGWIATSAAATASTPLPALPAYDGTGSKNNPAVRPPYIIYSGDGSAYLAGSNRRHRNLHWTSWTATSANGSGANWLNDCTPNCAAGHFTVYPGTLHAYRPRRIGRYLLFTRLTITYTGKRPGHPKSYTFTAGYSGGLLGIG